MVRLTFCYFGQLRAEASPPISLRVLFDKEKRFP